MLRKVILNLKHFTSWFIKGEKKIPTKLDNGKNQSVTTAVISASQSFCLTRKTEDPGTD